MVCICGQDTVRALASIGLQPPVVQASAKAAAQEDDDEVRKDLAPLNPKPNAATKSPKILAFRFDRCCAHLATIRRLVLAGR